MTAAGWFGLAGAALCLLILLARGIWLTYFSSPAEIEAYLDRWAD